MRRESSVRKCASPNIDEQSSSKRGFAPPVEELQTLSPLLLLLLHLLLQRHQRQLLRQTVSL